MTPRLSLTTVIAIAGAAMLAGVATQRYLSPQAGANVAKMPATQVATVIDTPVPLPEFSLDGVDASFTNASLLGRWHIVFFGFTHCPDICPTTLATLSSVLSTTRATQPDIGVVFVSVDPERDNPERAQDYATFFDPSFVGVTGSDTALKALTTPLGILYMQVPQGANGYTVDHSSSLLLINPRGELAAVFSAPHDADTIAADLVLIIGAMS